MKWKSMDLAERNKQMNKYINQEKRKALPFSRKPTNEYRKNNGIRKSPFGSHHHWVNV